jgi:hypothetical protein
LINAGRRQPSPASRRRRPPPPEPTDEQPRGEDLEAIEKSARRPDGTLDPDRLNVRDVQRLSRAKNNVVCTVVAQWREQQKALGKGGSKKPPPRKAVIASARKPAASATDAKPRPVAAVANVPEPPRDVAPEGDMARELAALREQVAQLMTSLAAPRSIPAGHDAQAEPEPPPTGVLPAPGTDVAADAPVAADPEPGKSDAVRTTAPVETAREFLADVDEPRPPAEAPARTGVESGDGAALRPPIGGTEAVASKEVVVGRVALPALQPAPDHLEEAAAEAVLILSARGLLTAVQVYDYLPERLKSLIGRRRAQELLRLAASRSDQVQQLPDRHWMFAERIIQIPRQRRKPDEYFEIRKVFADFAVELMEREDRPFAAVELWDRYERLGTPPFVRAYVSGVLSTTDDPRLVKLSDGAWWLADRDVPAVHCGAAYHSRKRNESYTDLGLHALATLTSTGRPMRGPELLSAVPAELIARLPARNIHHALTLAKRDCPALYRRDDKTWWIQGLEPRSAPLAPRRDRLASEAIDILRRRGSMKAKAIRQLLSADLRDFYPTILKPLQELSRRFVELRLDDRGFWSVDDRLPASDPDGGSA